MRNLQEIRGSKWSNPVSLERILVRIVRVRAHLELHSHRIRARKRSKTTTSVRPAARQTAGALRLDRVFAKRHMASASSRREEKVCVRCGLPSPP